ncbi:hypothetical protein J6590_031301 [Homalodisca vitripennis]|nr:hypothetical protein J6590_031301 [Homalodisca vitripennis]
MVTWHIDGGGTFLLFSAVSFLPYTIFPTRYTTVEIRSLANLASGEVSLDSGECEQILHLTAVFLKFHSPLGSPIRITGLPALMFP